MTPEATPSIPDEDYLKSLFAGEIEGASVVGMGPDIWDIQRRVVPAIGPGGRYVGVHVDGATVQDARQRSGHNGGVEFHEIEDDLRLSRAVADTLIRKHAPSTLAGLQEVEREIARLCAEQPLVADEASTSSSPPACASWPRARPDLAC